MDSRSYCVLVSTCAFLLFCVTTVFAVSDAGQGAICGNECSVRDWLEATSGWVGAILTAVTFYFLYRQLREQSKQTKFMLGDGDPTMDSVQHLENADEIVIKIVNWNRRTLLVNNIAPLKAPGPVAPMEMFLCDQEIARRYPIVLPGWEDRSKGPHVLRVTLVCDAGDGNMLIRDWPREQQVIAEVTVLGESPHGFRLAAKLHPR